MVKHKILIGSYVEKIFDKINEMLRSKDFSDIEAVLCMRDKLFDTIAETIKNQFRRITGNSSASTKTSVLYLNRVHIPSLDFGIDSLL